MVEMARTGFVCHDLMATDVEGAKAFDREVVGFTTEQVGNYPMLMDGEQPVGGVAGPTDQGPIWPSGGPQPHWIPYISVENVDVAAERAKANGLVGTASGLSILVVSAFSSVLVGLSGMCLVFIVALVLTAATIAHLLPLSLSEPPREQADDPDDPPALAIDLRGTLAIVLGIPGLLALILFTSFNNFLGGVFAGLIDAYGLSLVSVEVWGGAVRDRQRRVRPRGPWHLPVGPGAEPAVDVAHLRRGPLDHQQRVHDSLLDRAAGEEHVRLMSLVPFVEAAEHTVIQKIVPAERQGRVFGFAQSVETSATPVTTLLIGPLAELVFIPFMTTGAGVDLIGGWFGTGPGRGIALVFTVTAFWGWQPRCWPCAPSTIGCSRSAIRRNEASAGSAGARAGSRAHERRLCWA